MIAINIISNYGTNASELDPHPLLSPAASPISISKVLTECATAIVWCLLWASGQQNFGSKDTKNNYFCSYVVQLLYTWYSRFVIIARETFRIIIIASKSRGFVSLTDDASIILSFIAPAASNESTQATASPEVAAPQNVAEDNIDENEQNNGNIGMVWRSKRVAWNGLNNNFYLCRFVFVR